jgi:isocitrate dehydrogenase kinase/phosphatase
LANPCARRLFREENLDLLSVRYWEDVQQTLLHGEIPELRVYPDSSKLRTDCAAG